MRRVLRGFFPVLVSGNRSHGAWGGKGTGIQLLLKHRLSVPRTGALPAFEVNEWIRALPGHTSALAAWRRWQGPERESPAALERFRQTILSAPAPMDWKRGCIEFLSRIENRPLIVRSSMSVEDDSTSSFAGAFESVNNNDCEFVFSFRLPIATTQHPDAGFDFHQPLFRRRQSKMPANQIAGHSLDVPAAQAAARDKFADFVLCRVHRLVLQ